MHEDEEITLYPDNTNKIRMVATTDYDEVYVMAYLDGEDVLITPNDPPPPDLTAPTVSSVFPVNGATNIERNTAIYAIFSEEMLGASITNTNITVAPAITYTVQKDSVDPTKVLIVPSSQLAAATAYTITLTTGLTDDAEVPNALAAPFVWSFTTKAAAPPPDTTPPTIVSVSPADLATNIAVSTTPSVSFSEDMLDSSVTATTMKLTKVSNSQLLTTAYTHSTDGKTVTMLPSTSLESSTQYRIDVVGGSSGVKDLASNALAASASYTFTTAAPTLTPTYSVSGNDYFNLNSLNYYSVSEYVNSTSSTIKDLVFKKWVFYLRKVGNPSGTITFRISDVNGNNRYTIGTYNSASLSTTADTTITFDTPTNTVGVRSTDSITVYYSNGDNNNYVRVKISSTDAFNGSSTCLRTYYGFIWTGFSIDTAKDLAAIFYT